MSSKTQNQYIYFKKDSVGINRIVIKLIN
jgi:hypothetical protein